MASAVRRLLRALSTSSEPPVAPSPPPAHSPAEQAARPVTEGGASLRLLAPDSPVGEALCGGSAVSSGAEEATAASAQAERESWPLAAFQLLAASVLASQAPGSLGSANAALLRECAERLGVAQPLRDHLLDVALPAYLPGEAPGEGGEELSLRLPWALLTQADAEAHGPAPPPDDSAWRLSWRRAQLLQLLNAQPRGKGDASRTRAALRTRPASSEHQRLLRLLRVQLEGQAWKLPPYTCLRLYSSLTEALWRQLSGGDEEGERLLAALRSTWPALGITPLSHSAHLVFACLAAWSEGGGEEALEAGRRAAGDAAFDAADAPAPAQPLPAVEEVHLRATLGAVVGRCCCALADYHASFPGGADWVMEAFIDLVRDVSTLLSSAGLSSDAGGSSAVCELVCASVSAEYSRCVAELLPGGGAGPGDGAGMLALCKRCCALLDAELELFAPSLEESEPRAACFAVARLQNEFELTLRTWLGEPPATASTDPTASLAPSVPPGPGPSAGPQLRGIEEALPVLRAAEAFVAHAQSLAVGAAEGEPPPPLLVARLAEPLARAWVDSRLAQLRQWTQRGLTAETAAESSNAGTGGGGGGVGGFSSFSFDGGAQRTAPPEVSQSAVDLVAGCHEAIAAFFRLGVAQLTPAVALTAGCSSLLETYAQAALTRLGDPKQLAPRRRTGHARYKASTADLLARLAA